MDVADGRIQNATLLRGNGQTLEKALRLFRDESRDPDNWENWAWDSGAAFRQCRYPGRENSGHHPRSPSGRDDHLGGKIDAAKFKHKKNATTKTFCLRAQDSGDQADGVWMHKDNREVLLIKDYSPQISSSRWRCETQSLRDRSYLEEYLLFHYGKPSDLCPFDFISRGLVPVS